MSYLVIAPLSRLIEIAEKHQPQAMLTLITAGTPIERPAMIAERHHLTLTFNDIAEEREGLVAPQMHHVKELIEFARHWPQTAPLLIHCQMGISRSTAAAFIIACALNPSLNEGSLAIHLRRIAPSATPNPRLISLADDLLKRDNRMIAAIRRIGRGADAAQGTPFTLAFDNDH